MTDLPNQNPAQPGQNFIPSNQAPAQPAAVSPAIKNQPVSEPPMPAWVDPENKPAEPISDQPTVLEPPKSNLNLKRIFAVGGTIIAIFVLGFGAYFSINFYNKQKAEKEKLAQNEKPSTPKKQEIVWKKPTQFPAEPVEDEKNIKIAKAVLEWLDEQRSDKGVYLSGYHCSLDSGTCNDPVKSNRSGLAVMWARFKYYKQTNNITTLANDLDFYSDENIVNVIQNNFWNCKLMYEIHESGLFSEEQEKKIEKVCNRGEYYPYNLDKDINEEIDFKELINSRSPVNVSFQDYSNKGVQLAQLSAYSSDFSAKYLWKKDNKDLIRSKTFFSQAVDLWSQEPKDSYLEGKCVLGISALDLYKATNEKDYLDFAVQVFEKEKIKEICIDGKKQGVTNYCYDSLFEQSVCGIFTSELEKLTKEQKYEEYKSNLISNVVDNYFNYPQYPDGTEDKPSFYSETELKSGETIIHKSIRENGLLVGLMMME